jgi:hypothetical protein
MFWVLIYITTNFLAPIPLISLGIIDFPLQFLPKSKNFVTRISRKSPNRLKPDLRPAKTGPPAKAGPRPAKAGPSSSASQRHLQQLALASPTCASRPSSPPHTPQHRLIPPACSSPRPAPSSRQLPSSPPPTTSRQRSTQLVLSPWPSHAHLPSSPPSTRHRPPPRLHLAAAPGPAQLAAHRSFHQRAAARPPTSTRRPANSRASPQLAARLWPNRPRSAPETQHIKTGNSRPPNRLKPVYFGSS